MVRKAPLSSLKSPLLMDDSWTPKEMWQQAHLSDTSTRGFGSACSDSGCFDSRNSNCCNPPGQCLQMRLKRRACHMAIHGFSPLPAPPPPPRAACVRIRLRFMETSQVSEKRNSINLRAADALHLEMSCSGSTVKQPGFKVKQPYLFVSVSIL